MSTTKYAGIVIEQVHSSLDRIFHYRIPEDLMCVLQLGMRVVVPFGFNNANVHGYVLEICDATEYSHDKIKDIVKIFDPTPVLLPDFIPLIHWMKFKYHCLFIEAIRCFVPPGLRKGMKDKFERIVYLENNNNITELIATVGKRSKHMANILNILRDYDGITMDELSDLAGAPPASSYKSLVSRGYIRIVKEEIYRKPQIEYNEGKVSVPVLTEGQRNIVDRIGEKIEKNHHARFLVHGVTGSGKTEVYIRLVQQTLKYGKQAVILVPEISLTPQTVSRFITRFGENIAIIHSRLSAGERYDAWKRIMDNEVDIVIGARSAVFAPLKRLGLIIMDESHEDSYKSDSRPRYHAREIAVKRCEQNNGVLVMGTATPNIDDYYDSEQKYTIRLELLDRIDYKALPQVKIVDMRQEIEKGNKSIFSTFLYMKLSKVLDNREQAILLLNRRGYAQFVSCRSCGWVVKCKNCDVSLTYHAHGKNLRCHYCGFNHLYPKICPRCKSKYIKHFGIGTQKVEEELVKLFPNVRVVRMDVDTTTQKDSHQKILSAFKDGKYDVLLGTQMIAKGLDFPNVTMVGIIAADLSLNIPEYRGSERTFQLITQVAGRAGRGEKEGNVVIQTYQPDHYAIQFASRHDYKGFYTKELGIRRQFGYPPFCSIIRILITDTQEEELIKSVNSMVEWLNNEVSRNQILRRGIIDLGGFPAPLEKIKNKYRWQIIIRILRDKIFMEPYHILMDSFLGKYINMKQTVVVDFDPTSLL